MRSSSPTWRTLTKAGSLTLLWLLCASIAVAAPHHRRTRLRVCDPHSRHTLRSLAGHQPIGPVSTPSTKAQAGLADPMLLLQRGHGTVFGDDIAIIPNDAPIAAIEPDATLVPAFEAIGLLVRAVYQLPDHDLFSPRSPRGPPYSA
jgi:hypothetical protein